MLGWDYFVCFIQFRTRAQETVLPTFRVFSISYKHLTGKLLVMLNPARLTMKTDHPAVLTPIISVFFHYMFFLPLYPVCVCVLCIYD